jgi:hypothetical protein
MKVSDNFIADVCHFLHKNRCYQQFQINKTYNNYSRDDWRATETVAAHATSTRITNKTILFKKITALLYFQVKAPL